MDLSPLRLATLASAPKDPKPELQKDFYTGREGLLDRAILLDEVTVVNLLRTTSEIREDWLKFNGKLVKITGMFSASIQGNEYQSYPYQGEIANIAEIDVYESRYSIIKQKLNNVKQKNLDLK